jgi:hypothetical protein
MRLDRNAPYEQVFGIPGVVYAQGGQSFAGDGSPVVWRREATGEKTASGEPAERIVIEAVAGGEDAGPLAFVRASKEEPEEAGDTFETMHWRHLAALLDQYGEEFTTKAAAIAFLRNKGDGE